MGRAPTAVAVLSATLAISGATAARSERIVVVYENRSGNPDAIDLVSSSIGGVLERKGYAVVEGGEVVDFQDAMRISRADPLPEGMANRILLRFQGDTVLSVIINFVLPAKPRSRGPRANAAVGLTAKLVTQDGAVRWRNSMGVLADDSPLSSGRDNRAGAIRTTIVMGCERLLYSLPRAKQSLLDEIVEDLPKRSRAAQRGGPTFPLKPPPDARDRIEKGNKKGRAIQRPEPQRAKPAETAR